MADVAPAISTQPVAPEVSQRCHLYVLVIATGCELNIEGEVKTCPDPALPVGALAGETTVGV